MNEETVKPGSAAVSGLQLWPRTLSESGMSLRDYFAAKALIAMIHSRPDLPEGLSMDQIMDLGASLSYRWADAMLKERAK